MNSDAQQSKKSNLMLCSSVLQISSTYKPWRWNSSVCETWIKMLHHGLTRMINICLFFSSSMLWKWEKKRVWLCSENHITQHYWDHYYFWLLLQNLNTTGEIKIGKFVSQSNIYFHMWLVCSTCIYIFVLENSSDYPLSKVYRVLSHLALFPRKSADQSAFSGVNGQLSTVASTDMYP